MKRNSTTLFLTSPGSTTPVPWVNNAPDFSIVTEPTLSVLTNHWNQFLASGQALEIIPDPPAPEPPAPSPQWESFNLALLQDTDFQTAAGVNVLLTNALTTALNNVMLGFVSPQGFAPYVEAFVSGAGITNQQRQDWATIASIYNLPADIVAVIGGNNG